jgi:hypothetical protein
MWRLVVIFGVGKGGKVRRIALPDSMLFKYLAGLVILQIVLLLIWQFVDAPSMSSKVFSVEGTSLQYSQRLCSYQGSIGTILGELINIMAVVYVVYLAVVGRKIPSNFNDGQTIGVL